MNVNKMNANNRDEYGDLKVKPKVTPDQIELDYKYHCKIIFKPDNQVLFEIAGDTFDECRMSAERIVLNLLSDWNDLAERTKKESSPYMKRLIGMLNSKNQNSLEYRIS